MPQRIDNDTGCLCVSDNRCYQEEEAKTSFSAERMHRISRIVNKVSIYVLNRIPDTSTRAAEFLLAVILFSPGIPANSLCLICDVPEKQTIKHDQSGEYYKHCA